MLDTGIYERSSAQFLLETSRAHWRRKVSTHEICTERVRVNSMQLSLRVTGVWNKGEISEDQHNRKSFMEEVVFE